MPRRSFPTAYPLRVHVGAGSVRLDGWVNTDVDGSADYLLDVTKPWPVPAGSVSHVFADNVVEHLTLTGGRAFLRNALAVMAPGGRIRLVTPDAEANARAYVERSPALDELLDRHRRNGYEISHPADVLRVVFSLNGHHTGYVYDAAALTAELEAAGFVDVVNCRAGQSDDPVLRGIDARSDPIDDLLLLTLEATAPPRLP